MTYIQSVSDITKLIKSKLERDIPESLVRAEISECKFHVSGHVYLTLKDPGAVMPAVIWRTTASQLMTKPAVGMEVLVSGKLSVYAPHGRYQFIINSLQEAGRGALFLQYEELKKRLINEGLCDLDKKHSIPQYPMHVGLVTSETAAALQDILRVFRQEAPHVKLTLCPARVQGRGGAETVIEALRALKNIQPDCVIVARGGGSIEDLWEFNSEALARYVADYSIPLIAGIGHETDTTIIDLVADHRSSTPTNAAEFICAPWREVKLSLNQMDVALVNSMSRVIERQTLRLYNAQRYLSSRRISENLQSYRERIDFLQKRSVSVIQRRAENILAKKERIHNMWGRMQKAASHTYNLNRSKLGGIIGKLTAYSPENVLKKGYTLIKDRNGKLLRTVKSLQLDDHVNIRFHDGSRSAVITEDKGNNNE